MELASLLASGQSLVHSVIADAHSLFYIAALDGPPNPMRFKEVYTSYRLHMDELQRLVVTLNEEMARNPIDPYSVGDPSTMQEQREERDELIQKVKSKNLLIKQLIDKVQQLVLSVNTLQGLDLILEEELCFE